ncbi:serine/threonine-protein kinase [Nocardia asteroides]|nr:serine/threonine-protein kinase [Nocardia asteroides]UGT51172.1 serine/threonine protein kinase [Nocardia asteroides]
MSVSEGMNFAGYRLERRLGMGGMGTVYLAQHPRLPRKDALKILSDGLTADPAFRERFLREATIAARLNHPNLVAVRDRGQHDGRLWIAMQYVDGVDLAQLIRRGPAALPLDRTVRIITEAAKGLDTLHRKGVLHRDVKPANILVAEQDGRLDRILVTDFGIARPADAPTASTGPGISATLAYAAPEQINGGAVDRRADVYALGCVLYELLTGSVPFPRDNPAAVMYAHLHEPPPALHKASLPPGFDTVIATALAKNPDERYQSCGALAAAVHAAAQGTVRLTAVTRPPVRRRRLAFGAAAAVVLLAATAAILGLSRTGTEHSPAAIPLGPQTGVDAVSWGAYTYVVQAFPELLPAWQFGAGYQEMWGCHPTDDRLKNVPIDVYVPIGRILCFGNSEPAKTIDVVCNADRTPIAPPPTYDRAEGSEQWTRSSSHGNLHWGTYLDRVKAPQLTGYLRVYFDDPDRSFCYLVVTGARDGTELRAAWWPEAPL